MIKFGRARGIEENLFMVFLIQPLRFIFGPFALVGLAFVFSNCGEGGKARYEFEPISDDKAVELLERAGDDTEKTEAIIARVRANRKSNFNFIKFWAEVDARDVTKRLSPQLQARLLDLHDQSCSETDFDAFANLVLRLGKHYQYIVGESRKCQAALSPERSRDFVLRLMTELSEEELAPRPRRAPPKLEGPVDRNWEYWVAHAKRANLDLERAPEPETESLISNFLLNEILRAPHSDWGLVACYLNSQDFLLLVKALRKRAQTLLSEQLVALYKEECR